MTDKGFTNKDWLRLIAVVAWLAIFVIWPQFIFAISLLIVGAGLIAFNLVAFWFAVIRNEAFSSVAPVFGGLIAAIGIVILPADGSWKWAWIPFLIDWGGAPIFLYNKYRKHPHQSTIDQCQLAVNSVKDQLGPERYGQASDYVSKYDEWLVGLEFAIDWLTEHESKISQAAYDEFDKAYRMMDRENDARLGHLRAQVSEPDR